MAPQPYSITQNGRFEPFELQVSRGQISFHRTITVFGYNPDVDTAELVVWPDGATVGYQHPGATITVSSSNANDNASGSGAQTVAIVGLDSDHNEITEIVEMDGQNAVTTSGLFTHVNFMYVVTAGASLKNEGIIYSGTGTVTLGVPASIFNLIYTGFSNSTSAHYTIPAGYTGYLISGSISSGQASGTTAVIGKLIVLGKDQIARVAAVNALNNQFAYYDFKLPIPIPEMNTVEARAFATSNNNFVSAFFQILLVKNDGSL
jgi:hypothetical protein